MLILIIILPLLGFLSGSLFGFCIGDKTSFITTLFLFLSFLLSLELFLDVLGTGSVYQVTLGSWINCNTLLVNWSFYFDSLTSIMLIIVTLISTVVHLYSIEYMKFDPHLPRFMSYLSLFTLFMLLLITANNFLQMFIGWEGVGLASYLLINFWFTRIQANKASIKAMLVNRVGDFFLLVALFSIYSVFESLDYSIVFSLVPLVKDNTFTFFFSNIPVLDFICFFLFLGAMGKSAQLGLHTWLPDAMEGPTPVSALIHAATMVTAGVFLIIRCSFLFEFSVMVLNIIMVIGASTAFFAATIGLFQNDIKKIIAYSTCSQLGYMVFACGLSSYDVAIFHLSNHAFFKALLFLSAGSVIHSLADEQDIRKMGGLKGILPFSYCVMIIGSLALIGFPFLSGFYSKDTILEIAYLKYNPLSHYCYFLGSTSAFFTAFYSTRLIYLVFLSEPNGNRKVILQAKESQVFMAFPLLLLALFSLFLGYLSKDLFIGFGTNYWNSAIFILPFNYSLIDTEFLDLVHKLVPLLLTFLGICLAYTLHVNHMQVFYRIKTSAFFKTLYNFLNKKWYFDRMYNEIISQKVLDYGNFITYAEIDRGLMESFGPNLVSIKITNFIFFFKNIQTGNLYNYLYLFFINLLVILCIIYCIL